MEKIIFSPEEGQEAIQMYVVEKTTLGGVDYLLVTEEEEGDSDALILKDVSAKASDEASYEIVSDDAELDAVASVFENILDDIEFTMDEDE